jgi:outer membrane protein assembly factor BamD
MPSLPKLQPQQVQHFKGFAQIHRFIGGAGIAVCLALTGCASDKEYDPTRGWSAAKLYAEAKDQMAESGYTEAIKYYEKLEARFPYGNYAQQAQMEVAYAYWKANEPASALAACDRFIKLHPSHPNLDYVFYLKGLIGFNEDLGLLAHLSQQDPGERDPKSSRESFEAFKDLVNKFPNSKYAPDATARMAYLVNSMAAQEVNVARYYMKRGAYIAAANRAQSSVQKYPNVPAQEEALAIMVAAYEKLGMSDLSKDAERVLIANYPNTTLLGGNTPAAKQSWWKLW